MSDTLSPERRATLHRRVRFIVFFTITWNVIEAIVALTAGTIASSAALMGFGLDSVIEVASAAAIAWQFTRKDPERWERATVKVIAIAFFALAAYVTVDAVVALTGVHEPEHSAAGIGIAIASLMVMPGLAWFEFSTGRALASRSVQADAKQLLLCVYLSGTVLIGLILNSLLGWAWADSVAALVVAVLAIREGIEAWQGELESPFEVLEDFDGAEDEGSAASGACALPAEERQERQAQWRAFEDEYELDVERSETSLVIHYAKVEDSVTRLRALVDSERDCCAFAQWSVDDSRHDLQLAVTGPAGQLRALNVR
ncbi:cation transporter [Gryllotalpicola reticulitermitis]|uniref:Cation transporter n=1 Tax=Gryllotalpicola reticulitermitis TaxID=1184153 RepID=A0ABV8Q9I4_9MICO